MAKRNTKIYDVAIVGAGPAGMTAAIYAGRSDKQVIIIDKDGFGGNIAKSPRVENIPGFVSISGVDFASNMYEQMTSLESVTHEIGEVALIRYGNRMFEIFLKDNSTIYSRSVIVASGTEHKTLDLNTKNIYYCATCDGPFFKNKNVVVVGSGNTGAAYALELSNYCKHVYLCDVTFEMMCEPITQKKILSNEKITWLPHCSIKDVKNDKDGNLAKVILNTLDEINAKAIFAAIGMMPKTEFVSELVSKDDKGYLTRPNIPGIFIAGDCAQKKVRQVTTAVADGTLAAIDALKFLEENK